MIRDILLKLLKETYVKVERDVVGERSVVINIDQALSTLKSVLLEKAPRDKDKYAYCEELATCQTTGNHNYNQANAEWRKQIEEIFKD
jgi:hypothetical protein